MKKVITYGTYDLLHYGHVRLLERAKALGDYLVVGVTADGFDKVRGKINVSQTLNERMDAVRSLGIADEIIVEEYEGQKIDDIKRMGIDVFTVGSDWEGKFDYLSEYCEVVYLDRTQGVSSSEIRSERSALRMGFVGGNHVVKKCLRESGFVNGIVPSGVFWSGFNQIHDSDIGGTVIFADYEKLLRESDAVYLASHPSLHYQQVKTALEAGKHVLCESPIAMTEAKCLELFSIADKNGVILADANKTAYSTAYHRLLLLAKSGRIGRVISVESVCTSLADLKGSKGDLSGKWTSSTAWGPVALLPILQLLGVEFIEAPSLKAAASNDPSFDVYGKITLLYPDSVGSATFGKAVKSEGFLVVSGTDGYIYVPAPWWKTDYFEIRKEDPAQNRRFFYQLDGEGIRNELVMFARAVEQGSASSLLVEREVSVAIARIIERFSKGSCCTRLTPVSLETDSVGEGVAR